jgi:hypothetical protein
MQKKKKYLLFYNFFHGTIIDQIKCVLTNTFIFIINILLWRVKTVEKNSKFVLYIYTQKQNVFLISVGQFFLYPLYTSSAMFSYINGPIELKPQLTSRILSF